MQNGQPVSFNGSVSGRNEVIEHSALSFLKENQPNDERNEQTANEINLVISMLMIIDKE